MKKDFEKKLLNIKKECENQSNGNYSSKECPDQIVATLNVIGNGTRINWVNIIDTEKDKGENCYKRISIKDDKENLFEEKIVGIFIIVLESPHTHEYNHNNKKPIGPAYGSAGKNTNMYFPEILETVKLDFNEGKYVVIMINAIQKQCSLGKPTKLYRDAIFLYYWEQEKIRIDFRKRLSDVINKARKKKLNIYIINACTKGMHNNCLTEHSGNIDEEYIREIGFSLNSKRAWSLHNLVQDEIDTVVGSDIALYETYHPSSWMCRARRIIKKLNI